MDGMADDDSPNGLYYSALHEQFTRKANENEMNAERRTPPYKVYENTDGEIVAATRVANAGYIKNLKGRFNDYARAGIARNLLATPSEITDRGREVAAAHGVPATFEGLSRVTANRKPG